ncbi:hypothetical protein [Streptosporangium longisporum]|uniref:hypothetical protein n=1 Tax=Streptosporangium longisporum TaxID=46187 RepID=UPI0031EE3C0B
MRALSSMLVLAAAGAAILTGTPATPTTSTWPRGCSGEEVFLTPELVPRPSTTGTS